jgi:hypothetical protein
MEKGNVDSFGIKEAAIQQKIESIIFAIITWQVQIIHTFVRISSQLF